MATIATTVMILLAGVVFGGFVFSMLWDGDPALTRPANQAFWIGMVALTALFFVGVAVELNRPEPPPKSTVTYECRTEPPYDCEVRP